MKSKAIERALGLIESVYERRPECDYCPFLGVIEGSEFEPASGPCICDELKQYNKSPIREFYDGDSRSFIDGLMDLAVSGINFPVRLKNGSEDFLADWVRKILRKYFFDNLTDDIEKVETILGDVNFKKVPILKEEFNKIKNLIKDLKEVTF